MQFKAVVAALAGLTPLAQAAFYSGFTTYTELVEGANNQWALTYQVPDRSKTLFVNVQILPNGASHTGLFNQFVQLCQTYGPKNISIIPRLRYGNADRTVTAEPTNQTWIKNDVTAWTNTLKTVINNNTCQIPLVQAGTLGAYGEWHDGPYCSVAGAQSNATDRAIKLYVVKTLLGATANVAVRTPQDYAILKPNLTSSQQDLFTIHDDCLMAEGTNGQDTGTFVLKDGKSADYWRNYTIDEAGDNMFGGEPCNSTLPGGINWYDWTTLCSDGSNGIVYYINRMHIAYLNPRNPQGMADLFNSNQTQWQQCVAKIQAALLKYS